MLNLTLNNLVVESLEDSTFDVSFETETIQSNTHNNFEYEQFVHLSKTLPLLSKSSVADENLYVSACIAWDGKSDSLNYRNPINNDFIFISSYINKKEKTKKYYLGINTERLIVNDFKLALSIFIFLYRGMNHI